MSVHANCGHPNTNRRYERSDNYFLIAVPPAFAFPCPIHKAIKDLKLGYFET